MRGADEGVRDGEGDIDSVSGTVGVNVECGTSEKDGHIVLLLKSVAGGVIENVDDGETENVLDSHLSCGVDGKEPDLIYGVGNGGALVDGRVEWRIKGGEKKVCMMEKKMRRTKMGSELFQGKDAVSA